VFKSSLSTVYILKWNDFEWKELVVTCFKALITEFIWRS
jgi:hypothetical protein